MGSVYAAHDLALDQPCALKLIRADHFANDTVRERFIQEARVAVSLEHPNIVRSGRPFLWDNRLFLTMELLEGESLRAFLARHKREGRAIPWETARAILVGLLEAMAYAHGRGLVHRDLKPENTMLAKVVGDNGGAFRVVVLDFGLVKSMDAAGMTQTGAVMGTLDYMSPEQRAGKPLDARSDVYSIGLMAYEALTGELPTVGSKGPGDARDDLPAGVNRWIFTALERDPAARHADAGAMLAEFVELSAPQRKPRRQASDSVAGSLKPPKSSDRGRWAGLFTTLLVLGVILCCAGVWRKGWIEIDIAIQPSDKVSDRQTPPSDRK